MTSPAQFHRRDKSWLSLKAINLAVFVIVAIAVMAFPVIWKLAGWGDEDSPRLDALAAADPAADAAQAIEDGDLRLIGLRRGGDIIIPGVEQLSDPLRRRGELRLLEPDRGYDELTAAERETRRKALQYIEAYNRTLQAHIEKEARRKESPL